MVLAFITAVLSYGLMLIAMTYVVVTAILNGTLTDSPISLLCVLVLLLVNLYLVDSSCLHMNAYIVHDGCSILNKGNIFLVYTSNGRGPDAIFIFIRVAPR